MKDFPDSVSFPAIVEDTGRGITVQYKNKYLYSKYSPIEATLKIIDSYPAEEETLYILGSPLLGHGISEFLSKLPSSSVVAGLELEKELIQITEESLIKLNLPPENFHFFRDPQSLFNKLETKEDENGWGLDRFRRFRLISFNQGFKLHHEQYNEILNNILNIIRTYRANRATRIEMGYLWNRNIIQNLDQLIEGEPLTSFHTGKPVVIAGAGESLEKILPFLKKNNSSFFILAIDTAAATLVEYGIEPDAILNLEGQFYNLYDFYPLKGSKIPVISDILSYPETLTVTGGKIYLFSTEFGESSLLERLTEFSIRPPTIPPLGSVGVAALKIASIITEEPILTAGLDFAYIPGKTHTKGSANHFKILSEWNRLNSDPLYSFSVKRGMIEEAPLTAKNNFLKTDLSLQNYSLQFRQTVSKLNQTVFDLTNGGLDLSVPFITEEQAMELTKISSRKSEEKSHKSKSHNPTQTFSNLSKFLITEITRIQKIENFWRLYTENDSSKEHLKELINALKTVPYLYDHFPDRLPHPKEDLSFLTRSVTNAVKFKRIYEKKEAQKSLQKN